MRSLAFLTGYSVLFNCDCHSSGSPRSRSWRQVVYWDAKSTCKKVGEMLQGREPLKTRLLNQLLQWATKAISTGKLENNVIQAFYNYLLSFYNYLRSKGPAGIHTLILNSHWLKAAPRVLLISQHFQPTVQEGAEQPAVVLENKLSGTKMQTLPVSRYGDQVQGEDPGIQMKRPQLLLQLSRVHITLVQT